MEIIGTLQTWLALFHFYIKKEQAYKVEQAGAVKKVMRDKTSTFDDLFLICGWFTIFMLTFWTIRSFPFQCQYMYLYSSRMYIYILSMTIKQKIIYFFYASIEWAVRKLKPFLMIYRCVTVACKFIRIFFFWHTAGF